MKISVQTGFLVVTGIVISMMKICAHDGPKYPCDRPAARKGYCIAHYTRHNRGRPMDRPIRPRNKSRSSQIKRCAHDGPKYPCNEPREMTKDGTVGSRYCIAHKSRAYRGSEMDVPIERLDKFQICAHDGPLYPCNRPRRMTKDGIVGSRYCSAHQSRKVKGTPMDVPIKVVNRTKSAKSLNKKSNGVRICAHDGPLHPCNKPAHSSSRFCSAHHGRYYKGKPMDVKIRARNKRKPSKILLPDRSTRISKKTSNRFEIPWWAEGLGLETLGFMD